MLQKWKSILENWINCYSNERETSTVTINLEILLDIVTHLRSSSLDDSKSSLLEARTISEFVLEKYPEFKFDNGTTEPDSEDELYVAASLLLFFVCVNSKDVGFKNAMCKNLSDSDQKTILKFSKCLMGCTQITSIKVLQAIAEACGQDVAGAETFNPATVSETPPAIRSLHSEVRRLQAALDAERFDRNYLQDELTRTNLKLEKLSKDKDQYKLDIVNLKAKISLCCGDENKETCQNTLDNNSAKLLKQLEQTEEQLLKVQEELSDVQYERDSYKEKLDDLKRDRDKYVSLSQQECMRASQLAEELEAERRQNNSLKDLVLELKQHNRLNGLDSSQLECDDFDTSIHLLQNNSSVCSEACNNVIEVQLSEEKAKVILLKQQIQTLQDQFQDLNQKYEQEKQNFTVTLSDKDTYILNLKHRINEEIEEKNTLKFQYNDMVTKLNNEINELEQTLKNTRESSGRVIESKMLEIQALQDEKLSILQSFSNNTMKLETANKELKAEYDAERSSKIKMREDYENRMMKLNEKILNRNNELVELQNKILSNGEQIEQLQLQLKNEKEMKQDLTNKYNIEIHNMSTQIKEYENILQSKYEEIREMHNKIQEYAVYTNKLNTEKESLLSSIAELKDSCKIIEDAKNRLEDDKQTLCNRIKNIEDNVREIQHINFEDKEKLQHKLDETNVTVDTLKSQLQMEIEFKIDVQDKLKKAESDNEQLSIETNRLKDEVSKLTEENLTKQKIISEKDLCLSNEKEFNKDMQSQCEELNNKIALLINEVQEKNTLLQSLEDNKNIQQKLFEEELQKGHQLLSTIKNELENNNKHIHTLNKEKEDLTATLKNNINTINDLEEKLTQAEEEKENAIQKLLKDVLEHEKNFTNLQKDFNELDKSHKEHCNKLKNDIENKNLEMRTIKETLEDKQGILQEINNKLLKTTKEKEILEEQLQIEVSSKNEFKEGYISKCALLDTVTAQQNEEMITKRNEISDLKEKIVYLSRENENKSKENMQLTLKIDQMLQKLNEKDCEIKDLQKNINNLELQRSELEEDLKKKIDEKLNIIQSLQYENVQLHYTIEEENINHDLVIKEKDLVIESLEEQMNSLSNNLGLLKKSYENDKLLWEESRVLLQKNNSEQSQKLMDSEKLEIDLKNQLSILNDDKSALMIEIKSLKIKIAECESVIENLNSEKVVKDLLENEKENLIKERENLIEKTIIDANTTKIITAERDILLNEKAILIQELTEEKFIRKISDQSKETLLADYQVIKQEIVNLQQIKTKLLEERECLTQQLVEEKLSKELAEQETKNIRHLLTEIENKTAENDLHKKNLEELNMALTSDNESLKTEITKLQAVVRSLEHKKLELDRDNQELYGQFSALKLDLSNCEQREEILVNEIKALIEKKDFLEESLNELQLAHDKLKSENMVLVSNNELQTDQIIGLKSEQCILKQNILELNRKNEELLGEVATNIERKKALIVEKEKLLNTINEMDLSLNKVKSENSISSTNIEALLNEISELKSVRDLLEQRILELDCKNKEICCQVTDMTLDLTKSKEVNADLIAQNKSLIAEREMLSNSLCDMKSTLDQIKLENNDLSLKIEEINNNFELELNVKEKEFQFISGELKQLASDYKNVVGEREQINEKLHSGMVTLIENIKQNNTDEEIVHKLRWITDNKLEFDEIWGIILDTFNTLSFKMSMYKNLETDLEQKSSTVNELSDAIIKNETLIYNLQEEVATLQSEIKTSKLEYLSQLNNQDNLIKMRLQEIEKLQSENDALHSNLDEVRIQLNNKVYSLNDKLLDNENLTEKLKKTYDCQIDNLNVMITKLTNYLKEKTVELDSVRNEKEKLQKVVDENSKALELLEEEIKSHRHNQEKLINDFESERLVLKNMVTVTESVMEDQKVSLNNKIAEYAKSNEKLVEQIKTLKDEMEMVKQNDDIRIIEKTNAFETIFKELTDVREERDILAEKIDQLQKDIVEFTSQKEKLLSENHDFEKALKECKNELTYLTEKNNDLNIKNEKALLEINEIQKQLNQQFEITNNLNLIVKNKTEENDELVMKLKDLDSKVVEIEEKNTALELANKQYNLELEEKVKHENVLIIEMNKLKKLQCDKQLEILQLEKDLQHERYQNQQLMQTNDANDNEKLQLINKCTLLQEHQTRKEEELSKLQNKITELQQVIQQLRDRNNIMENEIKEKDNMIEKVTMDLTEAKKNIDELMRDIEMKKEEISDLQQKLFKYMRDKENLNVIRLENEELLLLQAIETKQNHTDQELIAWKNDEQVQRSHRDIQLQVHDTSSDITHSSKDLQSISALEKIIEDRNQTITNLQSDITYLKTLYAESENKLLDVSRDLELSKENCQQLSSQLKKIIHQKNDEISDLKKQITKMSVNENRASQIIKVSAKYQAIILKRIAEIKSNTVLKELTNFGNSANCDNDLRRSLNAGAITMEDLENFLETTEKHIRRCSEKQIALQKENDKLQEVKKLNNSEIINLKKFLTELYVSVKTFNSVREVYTQKLSAVVPLQRTVRREILNLDGCINDATMCKLERGYAAAMQDYSECMMSMSRWMERCINLAVSTDKIKQAHMSENDRASLSSGFFQNRELEVQLQLLEEKFQKLLEEVVRAQKGEGAKDQQALTVKEVRAEYEDKLNRMKAKMKQLYTEQIALFKEQQRGEIASLELELQKAREKLQESSKVYEDHIRSLTTELWNVGEKYILKEGEAEWLRKKQKSGSLMSLQHVHSSGLVGPPEKPPRPSDTYSLRSLPVNNNTKENKEGRGLHVSDEEGEVFDNRWLRELSATPRGTEAGRLSELRYRNSLCPPHLKSSYPAETQFSSALHEEDIKCVMSLGGKQQRKEVGITAYKKPGPPTPSKQAGRLSATDAELRESLRVESEPTARKTSTPSRIRMLFKSSKHDAGEGTPRTRRLSNIFRKK